MKVFYLTVSLIVAVLAVGSLSGDVYFNFLAGQPRDEIGKSGNTQVKFPVPEQTQFGQVENRWNLNAINASSAWDIAQGEEMIVAVIDSGVVFGGDELPYSTRWQNDLEVDGVDGVDDDGNGYIDDYYGFDFGETVYDNDTNEDVTGDDINTHGTFIAGIIAGSHNGDKIAGVAPKVKIMDLRVLEVSGGFNGFHRIVDAFQYALDMNASVINFSIWFSLGASIELSNLFEVVNEAGIPIVGITGNNFDDMVSQPAAEDTVIATAAITQSKDRALFSNTGDHVEIGAPGAFVESIVDNDILTTGSGTSFAAPHVSATLALMRSIRYDLSTDILRAILRASNQDILDPGWDEDSGWGLLNTGRAVEYTLKFDEMDFDNDGLLNPEEITLGTYIDDADSDNDFLTDGYENANSLDPLVFDSDQDADQDGLSNLDEFLLETDPNNPDSDNGGIPDGFEHVNGLNPLNATDDLEDPDKDGLTNLQEFNLGTQWNHFDSDLGGIDDGYEVKYSLNPLDSSDDQMDTDGDGLSNFDEWGFGTNPLKKDSDGDGLSDNLEVNLRLNPNNRVDGFLAYGTLVTLAISTVVLVRKFRK